MNPTDSDIENGLKQMLSGFESLAKGLDRMVDTARSQMTPDEAIAFTKQMNDSNLHETIKTATQGLDDLKKTFNL